MLFSFHEMRKWKHLHKMKCILNKKCFFLLLMTCTVTFATLPTLEWHAYWPESVTRAVITIRVDTVMSPFSVIRLTPSRPELWDMGCKKKGFQGFTFYFQRTDNLNFPAAICLIEITSYFSVLLVSSGPIYKSFLFPQYHLFQRNLSVYNLLVVRFRSFIPMTNKIYLD